MGWEIVCKDCGKGFLFEGAEQERYARDGFAPPKRCRPCRAARRATTKPRDESTPPPATPTTTTSRPEPALHEAQCGACGALTRVPFEPTDLRPVYCQTCFEYR